MSKPSLLTAEERKAIARERSSAWVKANPERAKQQSKACYLKNLDRNREARRLRNKERMASNPEQVRAYSREWKKAHPEIAAEQHRRRRATPQGKAENFARQQLRRARKAGALKQGKSLEYLGCDAVWFCDTYLAGHPDWEPGELHLDHLFPLCSFDLTTEAELRKACHWTNIRPLSVVRNQSKGGNMPLEDELLAHQNYAATFKQDI